MRRHLKISNIIGFICVLLSFVNGQIIYQRSQPDLSSFINGTRTEHNEDRVQVGLVLSGGGARGIAHIGVLRGFEKYHIPIDLIVGTSIGSVVGGFYAAGLTVDQLEESIRDVDWNDIFSDATERQNLFVGQKAINDRYLVSIRFDGLHAFIPTSLTSGQKILSIITDVLYQTKFPAVYDFDNLEVPFRAISTDLISGRRVVISKGDLAEAINASVAVPLLFSPVVWEEMQLVDGGLSANFAVDEARSLGMDVVIVVDNTSPLRTRDELQAPWEIADQVTTIMTQTTNEKQIQLADLVIKPDLNGIGSTDFEKIDEMLIEGELSVDKLATQLFALTEQKKSEKSVPWYNYSKFEISPAAYSEEIKKSYRLNAENENNITVEMIKDDLDIIYSSGYYKSVQASMRSSENDSILVYSLVETDDINRIEFEGSALFADSLMQKLVKYQPGSPLNINQISKGLSEIKGMYRSYGYALIRFKDIEFNPTNGLLKVHIDEGVIGEIRIEGNEISEDIIILREFPLSKNDIYNSRLVKQGIDNIYNTQLFDKVSVNVDIRDGKNILNIKVLEKKHIVLRLGGKVGSERGAQLYGEWADENFLGNAYKLYLESRYGEYDRRIGLNYRVDQVFETLLTTSLKVYYDWKRFPFFVSDEEKGEYLEIRRGARFGIGLQLQKLGQISIEMRLENVKDSPYSGDLAETQQERVSQRSELRTLSVKSVTDNRDNIAFTTNGIYNVWFWETANQQFVRGQEKYTKAFVNLEGFYTYWLKHTFHFRGLIGIGDKTLPFSEWFRIGGLHDFIGLHDSEYFGRQVILANLEYRFLLPFEIVSDVYLAFRYDIGAIWETADLVLESEDFFTGIGGWLGINTILGPLYFGYGDTSNKTGIYYISLGYNF